MESRTVSETELEELRRIGPEGRLQIALDLSQREYDRVRAEIRSDFPEMTGRQIIWELVRRLHGIELPARYRD